MRYETLETGEVLVTITADEPLKDLVPWSKSQDGKTLSQVFSTNMRMTLIVFSETGHSAILTIEVTNVNKSDATEEEKIRSLHHQRMRCLLRLRRRPLTTPLPLRHK